MDGFGNCNFLSICMHCFIISFSRISFFYIISHSIKFLSLFLTLKKSGLYEAYKKYHNLEWKDLIQPTIDLAENGYPMTLRMYEAADAEKAKLLKDPGLR